MDRDDDYHLGLIGNGRTAALVDRDGSVRFACLPDFDSGSVFCGLLDAERGGELRVAMEGGAPAEQSYVPGTHTIRTRLEGPDGALEVHDFMPRSPVAGEVRPQTPPAIVRVLSAVSGAPRVRIHHDPRLDFGRGATATRVVGPGHLESSVVDDDELCAPGTVHLYTNADAGRVRDGEPFALDHDVHLVVTHGDELPEPDAAEVRRMREATEASWRRWSARTLAPEPWAEPVRRSALVLALMQHAPTGALVAAPTTSLPEAIGEARNWDYRFCWLRDASMTVSALHRVGHPGAARRFVEWVLDLPPDAPLQIMYGLRGERTLTERELPHLRGYHGSRPVRVGNAAYAQQQHDIHGAVLDVVWQTLDHFRERPDRIEALWALVRSMVGTVERVWSQPDKGIWEFRGEDRHFVSSKVMCWVAVDRAIRIARALGHARWAERHRRLAEAIRRDVLERGWSSRLGAFGQSYGSDEPDASNLRMAELGFLPATDARYVATVERTWELLGRGEGLLMRYRATDDFGEPSSAFTLCCFWGVQALARIGQTDRARRAFERLLGDRNHLGLLGEDLHLTSRRQLGNFPQAYSHLALIEAALTLAEPTGAAGW